MARGRPQLRCLCQQRLADKGSPAVRTGGGRQVRGRPRQGNRFPKADICGGPSALMRGLCEGLAGLTKGCRRRSGGRRFRKIHSCLLPPAPPPHPVWRRHQMDLPYAQWNRFEGAGVKGWPRFCEINGRPASAKIEIDFTATSRDEGHIL